MEFQNFLDSFCGETIPLPDAQEHPPPKPPPPPPPTELTDGLKTPPNPPGIATKLLKDVMGGPKRKRPPIKMKIGKKSNKLIEDLRKPKKPFPKKPFPRCLMSPLNKEAQTDAKPEPAKENPELGKGRKLEAILLQPCFHIDLYV